MNPVSHLAIVIGSLRMGGAERAAVHLANEFSSRGIRTDVVMVNAEGEFIADLRKEVRIVDLHAKRTRKAGKAFANYLKEAQPEIIIAIQTHVQLMVLMTLHRHRSRVPVILNEQSVFSVNVPASGIRNLLLRLLVKKYFPLAAAVAAVSTASAMDFTNCFPELNGRVDVIFNPVLPNGLPAFDCPVPVHPFFNNTEVPVVIAAGRLTPGKDFSTLIRAFAFVRNQKEARLIILGEGEERKQLEELSEELQMKEDISLPGFISNPMSMMNYASVFVLSSKYEGLPFVLVEAMAAGCQVVSTDCPGGAAEILQDGKYGKLVPVGNAEKMAEAIVQALKNPADRALLRQRASEFTAAKAVNHYLDLINRIQKGNG